MPDDPRVQDLEQKLASAAWLSEDGRELLARLLSVMRYASSALDASPSWETEEKSILRDWGRRHWLATFDICQKLEAAENEWVETQAEIAVVMRRVALSLLHSSHRIRNAIEEETHSGPCEGRGFLRKRLETLEKIKPSLLERITADDIRELETQGIL